MTSERVTQFAFQPSLPDSAPHQGHVVSACPHPMRQEPEEKLGKLPRQTGYTRSHLRMKIDTCNNKPQPVCLLNQDVNIQFCCINHTIFRRCTNLCQISKGFFCPQEFQWSRNAARQHRWCFWAVLKVQKLLFHWELHSNQVVHPV